MTENKDALDVEKEPTVLELLIEIRDLLKSLRENGIKTWEDNDW